MILAVAMAACTPMLEPELDELDEAATQTPITPTPTPIQLASSSLASSSSSSNSSNLEEDVSDWRHYWPADGDGSPCPFVSNAALSPSEDGLRLAFRAYRWPRYSELWRWADLGGLDVDEREEVYHRLHAAAVQNDGYSDVAEKWHRLRVTIRRLARPHVSFGVPGRQLNDGRRVPDFEGGWGKASYTLNIPWSKPSKVRSNAERPVTVVSGKKEEGVGKPAWEAAGASEPWYAATAGYEFRGDHAGAAWARISFYPREGYGRSFGDHPCDQSMSLNYDRRWWFWGKTPPWPTYDS